MTTPTTTRAAQSHQPMRGRGFAALALALLASTSCSEDGTTGPQTPVVASISVSAATVLLVSIDETSQLVAVARDASGEPVSDAAVTWTSAAPGIVSVESSTGVARAVSNGVARLTASSGEVTATLDLTVEQRAAGLRVEPETWTALWIGARQQLAAEAVDANGHPLADPVELTWVSTDSSIVSIDSMGIATARAAGDAILTAASGELNGSSDVSVAPADASAAEGLVLSTWFARSDEAPALLVNGQLTTPNTYGNYRAPDVVWPHANVDKFQFWGNRIALLTDVVGGSGNLHVRDRTGPWVTLAQGNAVDFELQGNHIALLLSSGALIAKAGIHGAWSVIADGGVQQWEMELNKIGVLFADGSVQVRNGVAGAPTTLASEDIAALVMAGNRIALLRTDGSLIAKDGIDGPWAALASSGILKVAMGGDVIAVLRADSSVYAKTGLNGTWVPLATGGIRDVLVGARTDANGDALSERIVLLRGDGTLLGKDGINGSVQTLASDVEHVQLQNDRIGARLGTGLLRVKNELNGAWTNISAAGEVRQWRPIVDVPVETFVTLGSEYAAQRAACVANTASVDCITPWETGVVPNYGRFCGAGRPTDADWNGAVQLGAIDGLDEACQEHDLLPQLYDKYDYRGVQGACVVNYAIYYSVLRDNGVVITTGAASQADWDAAWAGRMPHLQQAMDAYWTYTNANCDLPRFVEETAGRHH